MILLDTDVMVDILRGYEPAKAWLESVKEIGVHVLRGNFSPHGGEIKYEDRRTARCHQNPKEVYKM